MSINQKSIGVSVGRENDLCTSYEKLFLCDYFLMHEFKGYWVLQRLKLRIFSQFSLGRQSRNTSWGYILRFVFLFWVSARKCLDALLFKNIIFLIASIAAVPLFTLCLKCSVLVPVSLRPPFKKPKSSLIGWFVCCHTPEQALPTVFQPVSADVFTTTAGHDGTDQSVLEEGCTSTAGDNKMKDSSLLSPGPGAVLGCSYLQFVSLVCVVVVVYKIYQVDHLVQELKDFEFHAWIAAKLQLLATVNLRGFHL